MSEQHDYDKRKRMMRPEDYTAIGVPPPFPKTIGDEAQIEGEKAEKSYTGHIEKMRRLSKMRQTGNLPAGIDENGLTIGDISEQKRKKHEGEQT